MLRKLSLLMLFAVLAAGMPASADPEYLPRQKNCVGNPPRQTEDPLSPPCVAYFEGDNGGETYPGVDENEIRVVLYNDEGIEGDLSAPYAPSDESDPVLAPNKVRTVKALLRYFQTRYMTYGRTVRLTGVSSSGTSCLSRGADASSVGEMDPFAVVTLGREMTCFASEMAALHRPVISFEALYTREAMHQSAPYLWSFNPDAETQAEMMAGFICDKLAGRRARFSTTESTRLRSFGIVQPAPSSKGTSELVVAADAIATALRDRCALATIEQIYDDAPILPGLLESAAAMAAMRAAKVTTLLCYCTPEATIAMQNAAASTGYRPEWLWDPVTGMDRHDQANTYLRGSIPSFGATWLWRTPATDDTFPWRAYKSVEDGSPNADVGFDAYYGLLTLFNAIQAAGPNLTAGTVELGLYTMQYLNRNNPYVASGAFGSDRPGRYSFADTAMGWWHDPVGTPPGGSRAEGCIRVMREGRRFSADDWPLGQRDLFSADAPCSGAHY